MDKIGHFINTDETKYLPSLKSYSICLCNRF